MTFSHKYYAAEPADQLLFYIESFSITTFNSQYLGQRHTLNILLQICQEFLLSQDCVKWFLPFYL